MDQNDDWKEVEVADRVEAITPEPGAATASGEVSPANGQCDHDQGNEETIIEPAAPEVKPDAVAKPEQGNLADTHDGDVAPQDHDTFMPISEITIDKTVQPRAKLDQAVVDEYAEAYRRGEKLPPVTVFSDFGTNLLADGFHRIAGAEKAGLTETEVDLHMGGRREAILYAVSANTTHGLRRTNADKHRAVEILLTDAEWCQWSDNEVARRAGVSQPFVSKLRADLSNNGYKMDGQRKVERGGTEYTMDVGGIGGAAEDETEERDGVLDTSTEPGTVEPDVRGNDGAAKDTPEDDMAAGTESVASGDADADADADTLIPRSSDKRARAGVEPTAVEVFAAFYHVFGGWVSSKKVDKVTASKFFNDVRLEIERCCPGFYDKAIESAMARKREAEAGQISVGKTTVGSDPVPLVAGCTQSEP